MAIFRRILCSALHPRVLAGVVALAAVAGCGQKGPLYLPTEPAAAQRATLPQTLNPMGGSTVPVPPAPQPSSDDTGTAAPIGNP
jgi:predicted small lipoprotein YifL